MSIIDAIILVLYLVSMLAVGVYFMRKNTGIEDYFVGGRNMNSVHVGLSVVATDVGGGFSIGLGGLGFVMGISGSWMLFTGLIGAWVSAVFLIPRVKKLEKLKQFLTFPEIFRHFYGKRVALVAALITTIGYVGFTSSQLLAGAKLASATFPSVDISTALLVMGFLAVLYTSIGGIKAVIYTDTIQWIILMAGLIFVGIPVSHFAVGGFEALYKYLPPEHLSFTNLTWQMGINWLITITPIWFVGMTLYQRIYACPDVKTAKRAWYIAGLLEYPIMAFMGVLLGMYARVALEQGLFESLGYAAGFNLDSELGMPILLRTVLPSGFMGLVLAAYFSAILSTADSCLMAASGSVVSDFIQPKEQTKALKVSQWTTLLIGIIALVIAYRFENVLSLMLYSYGFMVSGLLVPLIAGLFFNCKDPLAAFFSMIFGGGITLFLSVYKPFELPFGLNPNFFGLLLALLTFLVVNKVCSSKVLCD